MSDYLIDIGANLTHKDFAQDIDAVIEDALDCNIKQLIVTGTSKVESIKAHELATTHNSTLFSTAGVHPHYANTFDQETEEIIYELASKKSVVAIGECGLDYFRNFSPKKSQINVFLNQIKIAKNVELPLFLHQRDAHGDFVKILESHYDNSIKGVAHCFTGSEEMLAIYLEMGLYIGITGWICDERRGIELQKIVNKIPLERLMIETDCPYLLPRSLNPKPKSRRNEPKYLPEIVKMIALNTDYSYAEIVDQSTKNAINFFNLSNIKNNL